MKKTLKKHSQRIVYLLLAGIFLYCVGRIYFNVTAGFSIANISEDLKGEPDHQIDPLNEKEFWQVQTLLKQPFKYLGKGCQSYVFESEDGKYVIKFLKYQRFRPAEYLKWISFIPGIPNYVEKKKAQKREKLDQLLTSWKLVYKELKPETGLIYLHLNETTDLSFPLVLIDKTGFKNEVDPNNLAFLIQAKAEMLCNVLAKQIKESDQEEAKALLHRLIAMLLFEYERGLGDNDHALMQNSGVLNGQPIHIDVGQFSKEERFKDPAVYKSELFSKTYKFRIWLAKKDPELEKSLKEILYQIIGPEMESMKPKLKTVDEGA